MMQFWINFHLADIQKVPHLVNDSRVRNSLAVLLQFTCLGSWLCNGMKNYLAWQILAARCTAVVTMVLVDTEFINSATLSTYLRQKCDRGTKTLQLWGKRNSWCTFSLFADASGEVHSITIGANYFCEMLVHVPVFRNANLPFIVTSKSQAQKAAKELVEQKELHFNDEESDFYTEKVVKEIPKWPLFSLVLQRCNFWIFFVPPPPINMISIIQYNSSLGRQRPHLLIWIWP